MRMTLATSRTPSRSARAFSALVIAASLASWVMNTTEQAPSVSVSSWLIWEMEMPASENAATVGARVPTSSFTRRRT